MAKRDTQKTGATKTNAKVVALAAKLGRLAGTVHAKAEDLMKVVAKAKKPAAKPRGSKAAPAAKGRSGGVVDAPGKKHRKPLPPDPAARRAKSQAAKLRDAKTMIKTTKRRGRG